MSKSRKTAKARELQARTGMPYTAALRQVEAEHVAASSRWGVDLLRELVERTDVTEVHVFPSGTVSGRLKDGDWKVFAKWGSQATPVETAAHVDRAVRQLAAHYNIDVAAHVEPWGGEVNARLGDAARLYCIVDPYGYAQAVIRKQPAAANIDSLITLGMLDRSTADLLIAAVRAGLTVAVSGTTASGKTTLGRALGTFQQPGTVNLDDVRSVEDVRQILDAEDGAGALFTIHATAPEDVCESLVMYARLADGRDEHAGDVEQVVVDTVDLVVHMATDRSDKRRSRRYVQAVTEPALSESGRMDVRYVSGVRHIHTITAVAAEDGPSETLATKLAAL